MYDCRNAVFSGSATALATLFESGCPWDWQTAVAAAAVGNVDAFEFAFRNGCEIVEHCAAHAALFGHVDILNFILKNNLPVDWRAPANAHFANHVECQRALRDVPRDERRESYARRSPLDNCAMFGFYHPKPMSIESRLNRLFYSRAVMH